jgi:hypothetical protein
MIRGFRSVGWVAAVGGAALGCYILSLQVATERADLAKVERSIVATKQQIRSLQTELGTRGRLSQLEQWNDDVLALAAPASGQFLQDEFTLARLTTHDQRVDDKAPVHMASAETGGAVEPAATARPPAVQPPAPAAGPIQPAIVHQASYTAPEPRAAAAPNAAGKPERRAGVQPAADKPARSTSVQPAADRPVTAKADKPRAAAVAGTQAARTEAARAAPAATSATKPAKPAVVARSDSPRTGPVARPEHSRQDSRSTTDQAPSRTASGRSGAPASGATRAAGTNGGAGRK